MKARHANLEIEPVESLTYLIRGQRVIVDADLARVCGVPTKWLNEAVRRNLHWFPSDFVFQLTRNEAEEFRRSRSQSATLKRGQNIKYLPRALTEHGAIMAANVLNSPHAVQTSVWVVRALVNMRSQIATSNAQPFKQQGFAFLNPLATA